MVGTNPRVVITFELFLTVTYATLPGSGGCIVQGTIFLFRSSPPHYDRRPGNIVDRHCHRLLESLDFLNRR